MSFCLSQSFSLILVQTPSASCFIRSGEGIRGRLITRGVEVREIRVKNPLMNNFLSKSVIKNREDKDDGGGSG